MTAVQLQMEYLDLARKFVDDRLGDDADDADRGRPRALGVGADRLEHDPMQLRGRARLGGQAQAAHGTATATASTGTTPKLHLIDLQYSDIRPEKGLYPRLVGAGRMERLLDDVEVEKAMHDPPEDTRAYFRVAA